MTISSKKEVIFILSVDTEEEWDWSGPFPNENFSVDNIQEIPAFQNFCQEVGIKPTYFVDYAVADNALASSTLKALNKNNCEIGAHLHPWANPPFFNETSEESSHVVNLPIDHVRQKLHLLDQKIKETIGETPNSFRTGRWGINGEVLQLLQEENITVDSSVYPFYHHKYFSCETAPISPYWPDYSDTNNKGKQKNILEIPVTVGFNRSNYNFWQRVHKLCIKAPFTWLRINGFLWHSKILRKLYLSPELCSTSDMNSLIDSSLKKGQTVFHMYLHSSSLIENVTGLNSQTNARESICKQINDVINHLKQLNLNINFCTITEAKKLLEKSSMNLQRK